MSSFTVGKGFTSKRRFLDGDGNSSLRASRRPKRFRGVLRQYPRTIGADDPEPTTLREGQDRRHTRWQRTALLPDRRAVLRGHGAAAAELSLRGRPGDGRGCAELRHGGATFYFSEIDS